jgi:hypothetical protein
VVYFAHQIPLRPASTLTVSHPMRQLTILLFFAVGSRFLAAAGRGGLTADPAADKALNVPGVGRADSRRPARRPGQRSCVWP